MEFRVLGPLEVVNGGQTVPIPTGKQRTLIAALLLNANKVVSVDRLIDALWGTAPPATAENALQVHVSHARRQLEPSHERGVEPEVLLTRPPGYLLRVDEEHIDLYSFERFAEEGRRGLSEGDFALAAERLREGLALWRGPALSDVSLEADYAAEPARLDDMRLAAVEDLLEAEIALGRCTEHIPALETLIVENPLRERLRGQLMLALYRTGRQADALAAYQATRETLVEELGIDPSPALQRLERAILMQDPELELVAAPPRPAAAAAEAQTAEPPAHEPAPVRESRRRVTVSIWTLASPGAELEPEVIRAGASRALAIAGRAQERHGGTTETIDGETIRAVFGASQAHEDDALRAVRAATEALRELELFARSLQRGSQPALALRAGIESGLVLASGTETTGLELTGAPLMSARQLVQEASAGEILIGAGTERLIRHAVRLTDTNRGSWRVVEVLPDAVAVPRRLGTPLVGRTRELAELRAALDHAVAARACVLATILGAPGIGKSRLARELRAVLSTEDVLFLEGRCPPYGEGITYSPLREILLEAVGADLRSGLEERLGGAQDGSAVAERLAAALDGGEASAAPDEVAWATRRLLETLGRARPLVVCFDDVHWAEPALTSLIEHVAQWTTDAPLLLLALARPELAERPLLAQGGAHTLAMTLEPLGVAESVALVDHLAEQGELEGDAGKRIAAAAEGNPLFIEQLLAALRDEGLSAAAMPPTIEALVTARLDLLDADARAVLERGAVAGRTFTWRVLADPGDEDDAAGMDRALASLLRRQLLVPVPQPAPDGAELRFAHDVIREVCYEAIPLSARAVLHEEAAAAVARAGALDAEETAGHHLERAHAWLSAAEPDSERLPELAQRAATLLEGAGRRAFTSGNLPAAIGYLGRAAELRADDPERAELLVTLAGALREVGAFDRARGVIADAGRTAEAAGQRRLVRRAEVLQLRLEISTSESIEAPQLLARADQAIADLSELGDDRGLAEAWTAVAWVRWIRCRAQETEEALQRALVHARKAGDERLTALNLNLFLGAGLFGPTPVDEAVERCEELLAESPRPRLEAAAYRALSGLQAMRGRFDEARQLLEQDRRILDELGLVLAASAAAEMGGIVELLAGRPEEAERHLRHGLALLEPTGEKSELSTLTAILAEATYRQGRLDEALELAERSEKAAAPDDLTTQVQLRGAKARVLASRNQAAEAERIARQGAALAASTDFLNLRGEALLALGEVLALGGKAAAAAAAAREAAVLFERKGNLIALARARAFADAKGSPARI